MSETPPEDLTLREAAAEIRRLREEIKRLRKFAALSRDFARATLGDADRLLPEKP